MATNNFKLFDENKMNMLNDEEYATAIQRLGGVQTGVASSMLQNKFAYQVSLMAYAIAQMMNANGLDANDTAAVSTFVNNLSNTVLQKVADKASTAEAQAGISTIKWMTPALVKAFYAANLATQAEAEAGTNNVKYMSPLRAKQALDAAIAKYAFLIAAGNVFVSNRNLASEYPGMFLLCDGQNVSVSSYSALYSILGSKYGGIFPNAAASYGATWSSLSIAPYLCASSSSNMLVMSGSGAAAHRWSTDSGATWASITGPASCLSADCNTDGSSYLYCYGQLYRSTSPSTNSWTQVRAVIDGYWHVRVKYNATNSKFYVLCLNNNNAAYTAQLYESTDSTGTAYNQYAIAVQNTTSLDSGVLAINGSNIIAGCSGFLCYSTDYGHTWHASSSPVIFEGNSSTIDGSVAGIWWAIKKNIVYRSDDYGASFKAITGTLPNNPSSSGIVAMDGYAIVPTSTSSAAYLITDGGAVIAQTNPRSLPGLITKRRATDTFITTTAGLLKINQVAPTAFAVPTVTEAYGTGFIHT